MAKSTFTGTQAEIDEIHKNKILKPKFDIRYQVLLTYEMKTWLENCCISLKTTPQKYFRKLLQDDYVRQFGKPPEPPKLTFEECIGSMEKMALNFGRVRMTFGIGPFTPAQIEFIKNSFEYEQDCPPTAQPLPSRKENVCDL